MRLTKNDDVVQAIPTYGADERFLSPDFKNKTNRNSASIMIQKRAHWWRYCQCFQ